MRTDVEAWAEGRWWTPIYCDGRQTHKRRLIDRLAWDGKAADLYRAWHPEPGVPGIAVDQGDEHVDEDGWLAYGYRKVVLRCPTCRLEVRLRESKLAPLAEALFQLEGRTGGLPSSEQHDPPGEGIALDRLARILS